MKTIKGIKPGDSLLDSLSVLPGSFLAAAILWTAPALAQEDSQRTNTVAGDAVKASSPATNQPAAATFSPGVIEILKMADAGVSAEVIKSYIESSPVAFAPTEDDVIALKKHNVGDEIATLLLKRGSEARVAAAEAKREAVARVLSSRQASSGGFDPESYDYFRYYYLQPRALAAAYQRLAPYYGPHFARPYGYGSAYGFGAPYSGRSFYPGAPLKVRP
jgi:hypothetical protein